LAGGVAMSEQSVRYKAIATSSKSNEHYTPNQIIEATLECFGGAITLDPCSNSHEFPNVPAQRLFTVEDDGLSQDWIADTLYLNHPYSNSVTWIPKLIGHVKSGDIKQAIALVKSDNRTLWYADLMDACDGFCIYRGYLKFGEATSSAPFGSCIFYFGDRFENFDRAFSDLGWVFRTRSDQTVHPKTEPAVSESDRLLMTIGATEFRDRLLRGGSYSQLDDWAIEVADNLRSHRNELKKLVIELITADSASVCQVLGSLLDYYGLKTESRRETQRDGLRVNVYRLKAVARQHGVDIGNCNGNAFTETDVDSRQHRVDTSSDCKGEFSKLALIAGDRAELSLEDGLGMLVKIIEVLADGQYLCIDLAGRWRSPLLYRREELQAIGTHQNLL
jgi:DNA N-6-adenine-methyltransferase (Dam)